MHRKLFKEQIEKEISDYVFLIKITLKK